MMRGSIWPFRSSSPFQLHSALNRSQTGLTVFKQSNPSPVVQYCISSCRSISLKPRKHRVQIPVDPAPDRCRATRDSLQSTPGHPTKAAVKLHLNSSSPREPGELTQPAHPCAQSILAAQTLPYHTTLLNFNDNQKLSPSPFFTFALKRDSYSA